MNSLTLRSVLIPANTIRCIRFIQTLTIHCILFLSVCIVLIHSATLIVVHTIQNCILLTVMHTFHWFDFSAQPRAHFKLLIGYTTFWSWSIELEFQSGGTVLQAVSLHKTVILLMVLAVPALLYKVHRRL